MMVMSSVPAAQVVEAFFDAYRGHDVERMVELCDERARYRSVPFEICRKQRVVRGNGHVCTIGKLLWTGLINAFPDLTNEVTRIISGNDGQVAAEVMISGTQAQDWVPVRTRGRRFRSPHLFVFHVNDLGKIDSITSYSDNAPVRQQLGAAELD
jgi:ketosteroid isomerase-like protein